MTPAPNLLGARRDETEHERPAHTSECNVLDVDRLRNRCMGNMDLVQRVLNQFQKKIPEELAELERAISSRDTEQIARVAHRIKGTSANMSAERLQRAATEIETLGRLGQASDVPPLLAALRDEWEKCLEYASTLLAEANRK